MTISNKTFSNRESRQSRKGWYTSYTYRICPDCQHTIISPAGQEWACSWCERHPIDAAYTRMDAIVGPEPITQREMESMVELFEVDSTQQSPVIQGGEILELCKPSHISDDEIPF